MAHPCLSHATHPASLTDNLTHPYSPRTHIPTCHHIQTAPQPTLHLPMHTGHPTAPHGLPTAHTHVNSGPTAQLWSPGSPLTYPAPACMPWPLWTHPDPFAHTLAPLDTSLPPDSHALSTHDDTQAHAMPHMLHPYTHAIYAHMPVLCPHVPGTCQAPQNHVPSHQPHAWAPSAD